MAYDTNELEKKAVEAIEKHRLFFISDVAPMIGISRQTFYDHNLHESENISKALSDNRGKNLQEKKKLNLESKRKFIGCGYIYIVQCADFNYYKIGISKLDFENRLSALQVGSPFLLKMLEVYHCPNYSELEREVHLKYHKHKILGEWFELTEKQLDEIKSYLEQRVTQQTTLF